MPLFACVMEGNGCQIHTVPRDVIEVHHGSGCHLEDSERLHTAACDQVIF